MRRSSRAVTIVGPAQSSHLGSFSGRIWWVDRCIVSEHPDLHDRAWACLVWRRLLCFGIPTYTAFRPQLVVGKYAILHRFGSNSSRWPMPAAKRGVKQISCMRLGNCLISPLAAQWFIAAFPEPINKVTGMVMLSHVRSNRERFSPFLSSEKQFFRGSRPGGAKDRCDGVGS